MRLSLKAKLTALISSLVLLPVVVVFGLYLSRLVLQSLLDINNRGLYVANEVFEQARRALEESPPPGGLNSANSPELSQFIEETLAQAPGLSETIRTAVGTQNAIDYVSVTDDSQGEVLVHTDPTQVGRRFTPGRPFADLLKAGLLRQLRVVYGPPRSYEYEIVYPLVYGSENLDVRVGVSTILLGDQLWDELKKPVTVSVAAVLLVTLTAALLSFGVLRPLESISLRVEGMTRGEFLEPLRIDRRDEWGALSSKLNLLGKQMRGEKAAFVALKDNLGPLLSKLTDGLMLFDHEDRLVLSTPAVARFLGRSPDDLIRRPASEVFSGDGPLDRLLADCFRARRAISQETVFTPSAEVRRTAVSIQFVIEQGRSLATLVTLRDSSTRAQLENQIDVTAKLAALGRLTSGVAHEVKNPLNAMVLQIEILKSKLEGQDERIQPQLKVLSDEIRRLDRVVRTFLDFTRPVELHPGETDLAGLIHEVFALAEPQAQKQNVRLVLESNGALPPVTLDRDLVKQALLNMVLNGCQAMPSGGQLTVSPRALPHGVEIQIADEGMGIPPEVRPRIFSLFFTTKSGGTGIGLAMAYRIIQLHNGSIEFTSEVNRGTTFRVSFPA